MTKEQECRLEIMACNSRIPEDSQHAILAALGELRHLRQQEKLRNAPPECSNEPPAPEKVKFREFL